MSYAITTDKLDALYQQLKPKGVTMTALLAKACGVALAKHPLLYAGEQRYRAAGLHGSMGRGGGRGNRQARAIHAATQLRSPCGHVAWGVRLLSMCLVRPAPKCGGSRGREHYMRLAQGPLLAVLIPCPPLLERSLHSRRQRHHLQQPD